VTHCYSCQHTAITNFQETKGRFEDLLTLERRGEQEKGSKKKTQVVSRRESGESELERSTEKLWRTKEERVGKK